MAFKLNVNGTFRQAARAPSMTERLVGARQNVQWRHNVGYLESPRMHVMSAAVMFFAGLMLATAHIQFKGHHDYDMTPTGTIAPGSAAKPKSCS